MRGALCHWTSCLVTGHVSWEDTFYGWTCLVGVTYFTGGCVLLLEDMSYKKSLSYWWICLVGGLVLQEDISYCTGGFVL